MTTPILSLRSARAELSTSPAVNKALEENKVLVITAGQMARQNLPQQATYKALAAELGDDTPLFRFTKREDGDTKFPGSATLVVATSSDRDDAVVSVYGLDNEVVPAKFNAYALGDGGFAEVTIGKATIEVEIRPHPDLLGVIRAADEGEKPEFEVLEGTPPIVIDVLDEEGVLAIRPIGQMEIPPHSSNVPMLVDLEVTRVDLEPTRSYGEPRVEVVRKDTGEVIKGLIATGPIRSAIGTKVGASFEITKDTIGESFQILEVLPVLDKEGNKIQVIDRRTKKPAVDADGNLRYQMKVVVRRTTGGGVDLDLSL
jgi:hypothetical protein